MTTPSVAPRLPPWWLDEAGRQTAAPKLEGDVTADGVWAAGYHESLFRAGPDDRSWERVVVERGSEQAPGLFVARTVKLEPTSAGS